jgi:SAM-dependent methyltransferase
MKKTLLNWFFYWAGIVFLALSRARSIIKGYSAPKPFPIQESLKCVEYDIKVVDILITFLREYTQDAKLSTLNKKSILELGPGSDLGVGLYLLSKSAKEYVAIDVNNLIQSVPERFYDVFFTYLREKEHIDTSFLIEELNKTRSGNFDKLNYIYRKDFDIINAIGSRKVDIVFSNAAFEHFDNIYETIKAVSAVTIPGAIFIALVDLKTHSRWIRDKDPNNIYRYPRWLYRLLSTSGTPNRIRPYQYKEALEKNGWNNIKIKSGNTLEDARYNFIKEHLDKEFIENINQMKYLSIWIGATKV